MNAKYDLTVDELLVKLRNDERTTWARGEKFETNGKPELARKFYDRALEIERLINDIHLALFEI